MICNIGSFRSLKRTVYRWDKMLRITGTQAVQLEHLVRAVYDCDRYGVAHMADADYLGMYPFHAALLILAPRLRESKNCNTDKIVDFMDKYEVCLADSTIGKFDKDFIDCYIKDLRALVRRYYRCLKPLNMTKKDYKEEIRYFENFVSNGEAKV